MRNCWLILVIGKSYTQGTHWRNSSQIRSELPLHTAYPCTTRGNSGGALELLPSGRYEISHHYFHETFQFTISINIIAFRVLRILCLPIVIHFVSTFYTMARVKQATPLRRNPSSEFISREDRSPRRLEKSNGTNGYTNGSVLKAMATKQPKEAGVLQLILAAGGIYGSL